MNPAKSPVPITLSNRLLTSAEFRQLADVPPEVEWFRNLDNPHTARAYRKAIRNFMQFAGIRRPEEFRLVTRAHVIVWRDTLAVRGLDRPTIRHRLSALASLFDYLCDRNAVSHNPVKGVKRPRADSHEGKTPALSDHQARKLLAKPKEDSLKGKRDRAILATLLYHGLRRDELCKLAVKDFDQERRGVAFLVVSGKRSKTRYIPLHPIARALILDYLQGAGHRGDAHGALFRPLPQKRYRGSSKSITPTASTSWCGTTPPDSDSRSAPTHSEPRRRPTHSTTRRKLRRCRNGSAMRIFRQPGCMIAGNPGLRIARRSGFPIS